MGTCTSIIDKILNKLEFCNRINNINDHPDIVQFIDKYGNACIKCKLCKGYSGSALILSHDYICKYADINRDSNYISYGIKSFNKRMNPTIEHYNVFQRECLEITNPTTEFIIGSCSASTCVILCMQQYIGQNTKRTMLAHIDSMTTNPLLPFITAFTNPFFCDVYIVGGSNDKTSQQLICTILKQLKNNKFNITFAHLCDSANNNFAINTLTGQYYINDEINVQSDFPIKKNERSRFNQLQLLCYARSALKIIR